MLSMRPLKPRKSWLYFDDWPQSRSCLIFNAIFEWYGPEAYLGRSASPMEVHFEYLTQMRKIILSYTRQFLFGGMAKVQPHIQNVAKHSLSYMESQKLIDVEMFKNLKFFFKSEGGKVNV